MGGGGIAAYAPERCSETQSEQSATLQVAMSRTPGALGRNSSASGPGSCSTDLLLCGASERAETAAAEAAEIRRRGVPQNSCSPRRACDPGSLPAAVASADAHAVTSGSAADMAALLTAHRQIAMGRAASAEMVEVQGSLRACRRASHSQPAARSAPDRHMWTGLRPALRAASQATSRMLLLAPACAPPQHPKPLVIVCVHTSKHPVQIMLWCSEEHHWPVAGSWRATAETACKASALDAHHLYCDVLRRMTFLQRGAGERGQDCLRSLRQGGPRRGLPVAGGGAGRHADGPNGSGLQLHRPGGAAQGAACLTAWSLEPPCPHNRRCGAVADGPGLQLHRPKGAVQGVAQLTMGAPCLSGTQGSRAAARVVSTISLQYAYAATSARACVRAFEIGGDLQGVQQSKLAEAFGPEGEELQGNEGTPGKAERVQIGDALVALLESHRKHRFFPPQRPSREQASICSAACMHWTVLVLPFGVLCPRGLCLELFRDSSITPHAPLCRCEVASADPEQISRTPQLFLLDHTD